MVFAVNPEENWEETGSAGSLGLSQTTRHGDFPSSIQHAEGALKVYLAGVWSLVEGGGTTIGKGKKGSRRRWQECGLHNRHRRLWAVKV